MWPWWVKIPTEDFTDKTLVINDTYGCVVREIVVLIMEVDKVIDEVEFNKNWFVWLWWLVMIMEMMLEVMMWLLDMEVVQPGD